MQPDTLATLFPPGIVAVSADAAALWDAPLHPGDAATIADAVASRQRDIGRFKNSEPLERTPSTGHKR